MRNHRIQSIDCPALKNANQRLLSNGGSSGTGGVGGAGEEERIDADGEQGHGPCTDEHASVDGSGLHVVPLLPLKLGAAQRQAHDQRAGFHR